MGLIPRADPKGPGGRPGFPPLLMFKVLVIGHLYNLSDAQPGFQITDRHNSKRFLGMSDADKSPDEKHYGYQNHGHFPLGKSFGVLADAGVQKA